MTEARTMRPEFYSLEMNVRNALEGQYTPAALDLLARLADEENA